MPKELIDESGRVAWAAAHSAWGRVSETWRDPAAKRAVESPFRMLGQYLDEETVLCYTRFRYFDAEVGRWISPDPLGIKGGANLFGWNGDPANSVDPLGLSTVCPTAQGELNDVGPLKGRTKADIEADLAARGFTQTPANSGGSVWTKPASDGNTASVRVDPAMVRPQPKNFADEVAHAHKEIVPTTSVSAGNYPPKAATKLDDAGNVATRPGDTHIPIR